MHLLGAIEDVPELLPLTYATVHPLGAIEGVPELLALTYPSVSLGTFRGSAKHDTPCVDFLPATKYSVRNEEVNQKLYQETSPVNFSFLQP